MLTPSARSGVDPTSYMRVSKGQDNRVKGKKNYFEVVNYSINS